MIIPLKQSSSMQGAPFVAPMQPYPLLECLKAFTLPLCAVCSQDGWLELDAYYTGANRGRDPSDAVAPGAKPDGLAPSDSAVDLTQPQANPRALKTTPADDGHGRIVRCTPLNADALCRDCRVAHALSECHTLTGLQDGEFMLS